MISFKKTIVQFGFGAVGKSFFEKVKKEISFQENQYFVITRDPSEFEPYMNLGGISTNFYVYDVQKENYQEIFQKFLKEGDLLIDFADTIGTRDLCIWCIEHKVMYLNTGEADWPENWYSIFNENLRKRELCQLYPEISYPIVLQHGNNPGLVSHFVKAALAYIVKTQKKKDRQCRRLWKEKKWNELARLLKVRMIHVNDIDLQQLKTPCSPDQLVCTWCPDTFFFELLSEACENLGTQEQINKLDPYRYYDSERGFLEYEKLACDRRCKTYYPNGVFQGYLVPHEETITIAQALEVVEENRVCYRPTVMFLYEPPISAKTYLEQSKVNTYPHPTPEKPQDDNNEIIRGHRYPKEMKIAYQEDLDGNTEYVGVLVMGEEFDPVWVGNRVEPKFLYQKKKDSYFQTPTITPVAMSSLAAVCWMLKHQNEGGIYFPDDLPDSSSILKLAEKYISKTIYCTFPKEELEKELNISFSQLESWCFYTK